MLLYPISNLNEDIPAGGALVKNGKVSARNAKYAQKEKLCALKPFEKSTLDSSQSCLRDGGRAHHEPNLGESGHNEVPQLLTKLTR